MIDAVYRPESRRVLDALSGGSDIGETVRIFALSLLALSLAGCVSLTPQHEQRLDEIQRFADRATAVYGKPFVKISVQRATNLNIGAVYRQGNIFLNERMLDSPNLKKTIAHELGHYVLGHSGFIPNAVSQADWQRAQEQKELDANAKAVEILMRADGLTEPEAVKVVADALRRSADAQAKNNLPLTPGHLPASAELADLLARFPDSAVTLR
ncbi:MAG: hypothetical protein DMD87_27160 [Candidatus Rokuibacteriota bacterium]|nr:MAG: hypothetical protein DMD87_27160 [Candidatus Rokubacteria bacterium]